MIGEYPIDSKTSETPDAVIRNDYFWSILRLVRVIVKYSFQEGFGREAHAPQLPYSPLPSVIGA